MQEYYVGLIVQNSPHRQVKFNHRVCKIHRSPASIVNNVFLLMTSRTNKTIFYFCFILCIYIQEVVSSSNILLLFFFFLFHLIPKSVSSWSCSKCPPICAIHNDIFNSCTGCNRLRNTSHYWKLSLHMKDVVSAFPNMTFQKASREKMALLSFASNLYLKDDWKLCQVHWKGFVWSALPRARLCVQAEHGVLLLRFSELESWTDWDPSTLNTV